MTESEKRFKILKKTSYEEQLSREETRQILKTFLLGVFVILAISSSKVFDIALGILQTGNDDHDFIEFSTALSLLSSYLSVIEAGSLVKTIVKKTLLEDKIEDIELELKEAGWYEEESRDKRRWILMF